MPRLAASRSMPFVGAPSFDRFERAAARAGLRGVEFVVSYAHDPAQIRRAAPSALLAHQALQQPRAACRRDAGLPDAPLWLTRP